MKITGRKRLNRAAIELRAEQLLRLFTTDFLEYVQPTPLLDLTAFLTSKHSIIFDFTCTLGFSDTGQRIIGAFNPRKRVILIDASLQADEPKFNFTLAHELGHLALHRNVSIEYEEKDNLDKTDETVLEEQQEEDILKEEVDWLEWQANAYGSALLMPKIIFESALVATQQSMGISRVGRILVDSQPVNLVDFYSIISKLATFFHVSQTAAEYRLRKLDLVDDQRRSRSIRDILR